MRVRVDALYLTINVKMVFDLTVPNYRAIRNNVANLSKLISIKKYYFIFLYKKQILIKGKRMKKLILAAALLASSASLGAMPTGAEVVDFASTILTLMVPYPSSTL